MNKFTLREQRHGLLKLAAIALPLLVVIGCSSASSGHAPGVAGGQTLTPGITNFPLAYIKRPVLTKDVDVRDLITSITGGDLYIRSQASSAGQEVNVTGTITKGMGDVRDLDVSPDGTTIVFSLRLPLNPKKPNTDVTQPNWHIYTYNAATQAVTQLTNDGITAGHDVGARYLPDGRIVFASTRQVATQSILLDEGRPQYSAQTDDRSQSIFLLHVMDGDGTSMHQISFNTNHDFAPSVLSNGQIVFSRWETSNGGQMSLYRANPNGTGLELYYGANSHATGANIAGTNDNVIQFLNARELANGTLVALVRPFLGTQLGGDIVQINAQGFVEIHQAATPGGAAGTAQTSLTSLGVTTDANMPSLGGRFASVFPLYDGTNRMLVSWSPCLVLDTTVTPTATNLCTSANTSGANVTLAPPQYTLWIYDLDKGTLGPVLSADVGTMVVEPVILQPRKPVPVTLVDAAPAPGQAATMANKGLGLLDISSVYDVDGVDTATPNIAGVSDPAQPTFYARPYRFIRIEKAVEIPGKTVRKINNSAFGPAGMGMREILGYAPIQPDGSVQVQVPANVPFTIDIVDANAKRVTAQHTSWLQLIPGETRTCNGCHTTANKTSHGRAGLTNPVNPGAPATGSPFPNTNPAIALTNVGATMAQTLAQSTCTANGLTPSTPSTVNGNPTPCSQILSADVTYDGVWTVGTTPPQPDKLISYAYADLTSASPVTLASNPSCVTWSAQCRVTLHYANASDAAMRLPYLQSVWNAASRSNVINGVMTSTTCSVCHDPVNAMAMVQVPQGQLDLTGTASNVDTTVVTSYEQVLFAHNAQTLNMGVLQDLLVPAPGPPDPVTGLPTTIMVPVSLAPPMAAGSAAASTAFFRMFDGSFHDPVLDHTGFLSAAELRLIAEWLDIGAQFYNDPFVAPVAN
jgi:Hydrazine synthase alpha subunit middle domain/WD40-like Beta Propeller Repeat